MPRFIGVFTQNAWVALTANFNVFFKRDLTLYVSMLIYLC